jgi:hypothetical protein
MSIKFVNKSRNGGMGAGEAGAATMQQSGIPVGKLLGLGLGVLTGAAVISLAEKGIAKKYGLNRFQLPEVDFVLTNTETGMKLSTRDYATVQALKAEIHASKEAVKECEKALKAASSKDEKKDAKAALTEARKRLAFLTDTEVPDTDTDEEKKITA